MTAVRTFSGHELLISNDRTYTAATACTVAGINPVTLRSWRNRGWFKPQTEQPAGQWTLYSFRDLCLLRCAGLLTEMGIPGNVALTISEEICLERHVNEAVSRVESAKERVLGRPYPCEVAALVRLRPHLQVKVDIKYQDPNRDWRYDLAPFSKGCLTNLGRPTITLDVTALVFHTAVALNFAETETQQ